MLKFIGSLMIILGLAHILFLFFYHVEMTQAQLLVNFWRDYLISAGLIVWGYLWLKGKEW